MSMRKNIGSNQQSLFGPGPGVQNNIKSGFNHFGDLFSEFTKHIAPTYHHERPERSILMRLYTMHNAQGSTFADMHHVFLPLFHCSINGNGRPQNNH